MTGSLPAHEALPQGRTPALQGGEALFSNSIQSKKSIWNTLFGTGILYYVPVEQERFYVKSKPLISHASCHKQVEQIVTACASTRHAREPECSRRTQQLDPYRPGGKICADFYYLQLLSQRIWWCFHVPHTTTIGLTPFLQCDPHLRPAGPASCLTAALHPRRASPSSIGLTFPLILIIFRMFHSLRPQNPFQKYMCNS